MLAGAARGCRVGHALGACRRGVASRRSSGILHPGTQRVLNSRKFDSDGQKSAFSADLLAITIMVLEKKKTRVSVLRFPRFHKGRSGTTIHDCRCLGCIRSAIERFVRTYAEKASARSADPKIRRGAWTSLSCLALLLCCWPESGLNASSAPMREKCQRAAPTHKSVVACGCPRCRL